MSDLTSRLDSIGDAVRRHFSTLDEAREKGLKLSRDSIRYSSNAIRAIHRREYEKARELIASSRKCIEEMTTVLTPHGELSYGGFVHNGQKEYAEACITLSLVFEEALPEPDDLGVNYAAYLNGLAEAVGEMRRHVLDILREGQVARCEEMLSAMDDIYSLLVTMDFHDALTGGLRRNTDMVRGVLERTRGDLTLSLRQRKLENKLEDFQGRLEKG